MVAYEVHGNGPALLMPVNPQPIEGTKADEMRAWGVNPANGRDLIAGLADSYRVIAFDYEGYRLAHPVPLTPTRLADDLLAVADAAGVERFAYYGYSWLALAGLQLALRTDRLTALAMGGFPPLDGPYAEMLTVTRATHALALSPSSAASGGDSVWDTAELTLSPEQTGQFVVLYEALQSFSDAAVSLSVPRMCFAGSADVIAYGPKWGDVTVDIAGPLVRRRADLTAAGWDVEVLDGLDHTGAMQATAVLPVLRPWLDALGLPA
ncbi:MAG: alpha/beta hydrolase [Hamadaea sp.]|uniref:alpha/beta fold hydrolase n=1 Tax=Hamadaea sp. TaxID=2024425 RepID=UPI0018137ABD|nr:alpha/beta hydrolase [Hamadaea sp.]NUR71554.1 alpha/beta hydrolase [Hamadaea sp.]NUT19646.1 alpha/beta hydrolase [Hamadaea sp.]